jgi:heparanase 1
MSHRSKLHSQLFRLGILYLAWLAGCAYGQEKLAPQSMRSIGNVDPRYVSFNIEAVEVTGGRFWKPFPHQKENGSTSTTPQAPGGDKAPAVSDPYQYRPPIDLSNPKLRKLAQALAPAYVRVSGTWRNSTFFQNNDDPVLKTVPDGFKNVMTRAEWKGVLDFARSANADIIVSVSMSDGTRDARGAWTPTQAEQFFQYTKSIGGHIVAAEFMNEPTFAAAGGAPTGYDAATFAQDIRAFRSFLLAESPDTIFLGPGSIGEGPPMVEGLPLPKMMNSTDILKATGPIFDAFSYHFYTTLSQRCVGNKGLSWEKVLTPAYLDRNVASETYYGGLRDTYLPGKPIWLTETGEAGCGGDRWASAFVDAFRFADQLGVLAQKNVQTVVVNTLASSDYGLLNEDKLTPRPDYWIALFWKRFMGTQVLDPGMKAVEDVRIYAQCLKGVKGGVSLEILNIDQKAGHTLSIPISSERYTLTAPSLLSDEVLLNGAPLAAAYDGTLPVLKGVKQSTGELLLPPAPITFMTFPNAKNVACTVPPSP